MVNLGAVYGDKIFPREAYSKTSLFPSVADLVFDIILAYAILNIFNITVEYAFLKIYGLLLLYEVAIKPTGMWIVNKINDNLFHRKVIISEVDHYLHVFKIRLGDAGTYEDYLLNAAFDESLEPKMRVLAAMQYARVVASIEVAPRMDGVFYDAWSEVAPKYLKETNEPEDADL